MSRYTVVWRRRANNQLAELWLDADDRSSITADAHEIDRRLSEQAPEWGNEIIPNLRWMEVGKLRAYFTITESNRRVEVVAVFARTTDPPTGGTP
ncbi:MAG TPA: hypothetical protein VJ783_06305 [Pirellulales bacterium]|nr:hypothetical protein [Pirellulales bacterium]